MTDEHELVINQPVWSDTGEPVEESERAPVRNAAHSSPADMRNVLPLANIDWRKEAGLPSVDSAEVADNPEGLPLPTYNWQKNSTARKQPAESPACSCPNAPLPMESIDWSKARKAS